MNPFKKIKYATRIIFSSDCQIFEEQFLYGHREVLLNYSDLIENNLGNSSLILAAGLQHGWVPDSGIWRLRGKDFRIKPRFVWNKRWEVSHSKMQNNYAIGAPWLYLIKDSITEMQKKIVENSDSVLVFPAHSNLTDSKDIKNQIEHFHKITLNFKKKFVCLYWVDYVNPAIQFEFRKRGFELVCAGFGNPRGITPYSDDAGRATYLINLLRIFEKCGTIVTDEMQSGVFYGMSIGMKLIYSPDSIANNHINLVRSKISNVRPGFHSSSQDWVENVAPFVKETINSPKRFQDLAFDELGFDSLLSKSQLKDLPWKKSEVPNHIMLDFEENYSRFFPK